jgi:hypothetical protein
VRDLEHLTSGGVTNCRVYLSAGGCHLSTRGEQPRPRQARGNKVNTAGITFKFRNCLVGSGNRGLVLGHRCEDIGEV